MNPSNLHNPRILLVEDDETSREMLKLRLELNSYQVITAADGQEALDQAATNQLDIILLDMNLPVFDGWTVAARLKAAPATAAIPIIGVSAHAMTGDRTRALEAGCNDYVTKPVDWAVLGPLISTFLAKDKP